MTTTPIPASARLSASRRAPRWAQLVSFLVVATLAGAGFAGAGTLVEQEGVASVRTKEDGSTTGSSGSGGHDRGTGAEADPCPKDANKETCESEQLKCIIDVFGFCFPWQQDWYEESDSVDRGSNYSYAYSEDNRTGYEVEILDGALVLESLAGSRNSTDGAGHDAAYREYRHDEYSNNFGWSESHTRDSTYSSTSDASHSEGMDDASTGTSAGATAAGRTLGGADFGLVREREAYETDSRHEQSSGANHTSDTFLGIPFYEKNDAQSSSLDDESTRYWNRTGAGGTVWVVEPVGNSTLRIVGVTLERRDEHAEGSREASGSSESETKIVGIGAKEEDDASSSTTYSVYREWTTLFVDLANGLVTGTILYDRGAAEGEHSTSGSDRIEFAGLEFGNRSHETNNTASTWRNARVALDAAHGLAVLDVSAWDQDEVYHRESESEVILAGLGFGSTETDDGATHTDGVAATFLLQNGSLLRFSISYVNTSQSYSNSTDWNVGGGSFGYGEEHHETMRRVGVDVGSTEGSGAGVYREEGTTNDAIKARQDGQDAAEIREETTYTEYGVGGAAPSGILAFHLVYTEGTERYTIGAFGTPLFQTDGDTQRLDAGVGGEVKTEPTGHLLSYDVRHVETSSSKDLAVGGSNVGRIYRNDTTDSASVNALDGEVRATASRSFWTEQFDDSSGSEIFDRSANSVDASLRANNPASPVVGEYHVTVGYIDFADTVALGGVFATWCTLPAVPIGLVPWGTLIGALPPPVDTVAPVLTFGVAVVTLGLLIATCFFALAPFILIANPCLVADIAVPLGLALARLVTGGAPEPIGSTSGTAFGAIDDGYAIGRDAWDETFSCTWAPVPDEFITIPREARNWQPSLEAADAATDVVEPVVGSAPPAIDSVRSRAWEAADSVDVDRAIPNPDAIPLPPAVALPARPPARPAARRAGPLGALARRPIRAARLAAGFPAHSNPRGIIREEIE